MPRLSYLKVGCGKSSLLAALLGELQPLSPLSPVVDRGPSGLPPALIHAASPSHLPLADGESAGPEEEPSWRRSPGVFLPAALQKISEVSEKLNKVSETDGDANVSGGRSQRGPAADATAVDVTASVGDVKVHLTALSATHPAATDVDLDLDPFGPVIEGSMAYCSQVGASWVWCCSQMLNSQMLPSFQNTVSPLKLS